MKKFFFLWVLGLFFAGCFWDEPKPRVPQKPAGVLTKGTLNKIERVKGGYILHALIKNGNRYEFSLEEVLNTIAISEESLVLTRDNEESRLELTVSKSGNHKCRYLLKELDAYVDIIVDSAEFNIQNGKLELYYQLESDDQFTKLEINF